MLDSSMYVPPPCLCEYHILCIKKVKLSQNDDIHVNCLCKSSDWLYVGTGRALLAGSQILQSRHSSSLHMWAGWTDAIRWLLDSGQRQQVLLACGYVYILGLCLCIATKMSKHVLCYCKTKQQFECDVLTFYLQPVIAIILLKFSRNMNNKNTIDNCPCVATCNMSKKEKNTQMFGSQTKIKT